MRRLACWILRRPFWCRLFGHDMGGCRLRTAFQTWYCLRCGFCRTYYGSSKGVLMVDERGVCVPSRPTPKDDQFYIVYEDGVSPPPRGRSDGV